MAERSARREPDTGPWSPPSQDMEFALQFLRSRRRDPCAERVAIELERRRTPAELAAISEAQADTLEGVIRAILDGIGLTDAQYKQALAIASIELRRASEGDPE